MDNKLGDIYSEMLKKSYEQQVVTENEKTPTAGKDLRKGTFEKPKVNKQDGETVKAPEESSITQKKGQGQPEKLTTKVTKEDNDKETKMALSFDDLYNKTITENEDEITDSNDIESPEFSEQTGDFEGGKEGLEGTDESDEEIDVASELRMLADRLNEIADKFGVDEDANPEADIDDLSASSADMGMGDETAGAAPASMGESVQRIAEAIKSEPTPKVLKKTTLGPKMSQNPKASGYTKKSGAGKASTPKMGKDYSGKPSNLAKSTLGPKMSQNPSGTGPTVKGGQAPLIA